MNHYLFSYDINTKLKKPTLHSDIEKAMCQLVANGFQVSKLDIATTYHIIYSGKGQYDYLVKYVNKILQSSDARVILKIAEHNNADNVMTLWMTDEGVPIVCPDEDDD